ncbi:hypothetical protein [Rhodobacter ferrooxidans]|uniref:EamA domain-containing protein n=1 Tax=Rhodobacter ferrooxidans TaxID=371731 RepID=C8RZR3_9RHOB|nr:hypothetical protein [Rhodobacter sp. SW2]EEW25860.1 conserved hypothetical protein [Rhodobacter sp. SW2]
MPDAILLFIITLSTIAGDFCIKLASAKPDGLRTAWFVVGALLYGLPAFGWFQLMRNHSLASVAVFYSGATLVLMAALGTLVFRESFGLREGLGVALALAAVVVMRGDA